MPKRGASGRSTSAWHRSWRDGPSTSSSPSSVGSSGWGRAPGQRQRGLGRRARRSAWAIPKTRNSIGAALTRRVRELLLLPLDPVLERLSLATCLLDACLHRLGRHVARPAWIHLCCECAALIDQSNRNWRKGAGLLSAAMEMVDIWVLGGLGRLNAWWKNASSRGAGADQ